MQPYVLFQAGSNCGVSLPYACPVVLAALHAGSQIPTCGDATVSSALQSRSTEVADAAAANAKALELDPSASTLLRGVLQALG
ncbi:hypothetical protein WJX73_001713 [Symbiochloris irregularis]|uniref:Uncharacterized protein n=1 Tax=Symbiochloris irregularis TaxID=706552 RepID=A0AAW1PJM6_9CHLO